MNNIKISVLNDDRCTNNTLSNNHGLSLLIDTNGNTFLFDAGQDDSFIKNSKTMRHDLDNLKCIVLSHGHYDHTLGLTYLNKKYKLICHPDCLLWRKSKRTLKYNGLPFDETEFKEKFDVVFTKEPYNITDNVIFLGEIERNHDFECKAFPSLTKDNKDDTAPDDTGIVIKTKKGLIVITGCGHSGICNTIDHAKKITNENKIYAVIGGFHLKEINEAVEKTINFLLNEKIENIYLGHCTSDIVCEYFKERLSQFMNVDLLETGKEIIM